MLSFSAVTARNCLTGNGTSFEKQVQAAKTDPDNAKEEFAKYLDAATYGTNDKEKRIRRFNILRDYLKGNN